MFLRPRNDALSVFLTNVHTVLSLTSNTRKGALVRVPLGAPVFGDIRAIKPALIGFRNPKRSPLRATFRIAEHTVRANYSSKRLVGVLIALASSRKRKQRQPEESFGGLA